MASFSTLGFDDTEELQSLLDEESKYEEKINSALLAQSFALFGTSVDIQDRRGFQGEVLSKFDSSADELKEVLADAILAYALLGLQYAGDLLSQLIPGFSIEDYKDEVQRWAVGRAALSFDLVQKTSRKRLEVALAAFVAGTLSLDALIKQYNSVAADLERASLINETESINAFNMAIVILAMAVGFVVALKWVTVGDERVCSICKPRHGMVYPISTAPSIPSHFRCRCRWALVVDRRKIITQYLGF